MQNPNNTNLYRAKIGIDEFTDFPYFLGLGMCGLLCWVHSHPCAGSYWKAYSELHGLMISLGSLAITLICDGLILTSCPTQFCIAVIRSSFVDWVSVLVWAKTMEFVAKLRNNQPTINNRNAFSFAAVLNGSLFALINRTSILNYERIS